MLLDFFRIRPRRRKVKYRRKNGVLFSNPTGIKKYLFYLGNSLLLMTVGYVTYLYWPIGKAVVNYWQISPGSQRVTEVTPTLMPTPVTLAVATTEYTITIPKIGAKTAVVENVSPYDAKEYLKVLESEVVAQSKGSAIPGQGKNNMTYIFAHSTQQGLSMVRKNAVFYLLGELNNGDEVSLNYHGTNYAYRIFNQQVVSASQVEFLKFKDPGKEVLILQTCWPLGTDWKRLLVFAERVVE